MSLNSIIKICLTLILCTILGKNDGYTNPKTIRTDAPVGGVFNRNINGEPSTLHPITATDLYAGVVHSLVLNSLAFRHPETDEWTPQVAERWEASKDKKIYTFYLNPKATWSDGKPVTAEDVQFSLDAVRDPAYNAAHLQPYFEGIDKIEVLDPHTLKAYLKNTYFQNFTTLVGMNLIPKHIYSDVEKSKKCLRLLWDVDPTN
jgi:microcin C transport system substrate-binding protein